jgi:Kef-type K+ transport system membrane component KefB
LSLSNADVTRLLLALLLILGAAHAGGYLATRLKQPRVAGEILGGLILGPTFGAALLPQLSDLVFRAGSPTAMVLGAFYQLGLFLLMFCSGAALRSGLKPGEGRTVGVVAAVGNLVPFVAGVLLLAAIPSQRLIGSAHNETALLLVFGCAIAVTSVPVISKIMADLGILGTSFARIVLSVAVFEDIVLFVVISIALSLVQPATAQALNLPGLLGIRPGTTTSAIYYVAASAAFFSLPLILGRAFMQRLASMRGNVFAWSSPIAFQLLFVIAVTGLALFLGVAAYFGAFVAGILAGRLDGVHLRAHEAIQSFSFGVFIPIYFAIVGLQLDLLRGFDVPFFLAFLAYACVVKAGSVYAGARLTGQPPKAARSLAVALNARGGPAIVLASVTYGAHIINASFYVTLVLVALVTSMIAGTWLQAVLERRTGSDELFDGAVLSVGSAPSAVTGAADAAVGHAIVADRPA